MAWLRQLFGLPHVVLPFACDLHENNGSSIINIIVVSPLTAIMKYQVNNCERIV